MDPKAALKIFQKAMTGKKTDQHCTNLGRVCAKIVETLMLTFCLRARSARFVRASAKPKFMWKTS